MPVEEPTTRRQQPPPLPSRYNAFTVRQLSPHLAFTSQNTSHKENNSNSQTISKYKPLLHSCVTKPAKELQCDPEKNQKSSRQPRICKTESMCPGGRQKHVLSKKQTTLRFKFHARSTTKTMESNNTKHKCMGATTCKRKNANATKLQITNNPSLKIIPQRKTVTGGGTKCKFQTNMETQHRNQCTR